MGRASKDCCCVGPTTLNSGPMGGGYRTYVLPLRDMVTHIMYIVDYYLMLVRCGECGEYKPWIFPPFCRNPNL